MAVVMADRPAQAAEQVQLSPDGEEWVPQDWVEYEIIKVLRRLDEPWDSSITEREQYAASGLALKPRFVSHMDVAYWFRRMHPRLQDALRLFIIADAPMHVICDELGRERTQCFEYRREALDFLVKKCYLYRRENQTGRYEQAALLAPVAPSEPSGN